LKKMVEDITNLAVWAAGEGAAILLKTELEGFVLSDSLNEIIEIELERLKQLLAEMVITRERDMQSQMQVSNADVYTPDVEVIAQDVRERRQSTQSNGMFMEVEVAAITQGDANPDFGEYPSSTVEVISDDEYFDYEQQFKTAQSSDLIEDEVIQEDNPAVKFVLRIIDAIFFVGEKFFLVSCIDFYLVITVSFLSYKIYCTGCSAKHNINWIKCFISVFSSTKSWKWKHWLDVTQKSQIEEEPILGVPN
jgi:hypothetical protein